MKNTDIRNETSVLTFPENASADAVHSAVSSIVEAAFIWASEQKNPGSVTFELKFKLLTEMGKKS